MEKISGIIPQSARVQSVNLKESQTVRPGMPSYGAPVGRAALNGGDQPTTAEKAVAAHHSLMARRSGDAHKPEIVKQMTDRFFLRNQTEEGQLVDDIDINFKMDTARAPVSVEPMTDLIIEEPMSAATSEDEPIDDYVPPGTYIDVRA